jgi:hypothetical protein
MEVAEALDGDLTHPKADFLFSLLFSLFFGNNRELSGNFGEADFPCS